MKLYPYNGNSGTCKHESHQRACRTFLSPEKLLALTPILINKERIKASVHAITLKLQSLNA